MSYPIITVPDEAGESIEQLGTKLDFALRMLDVNRTRLLGLAGR